MRMVREVLNSMNSLKINPLRLEQSYI